MQLKQQKWNKWIYTLKSLLWEAEKDVTCGQGRYNKSLRPRLWDVD